MKIEDTKLFKKLFNRAKKDISEKTQMKDYEFFEYLCELKYYITYKDLFDFMKEADIDQLEIPKFCINLLQNKEIYSLWEVLDEILLDKLEDKIRENIWKWTIYIED